MLFTLARASCDTIRLGSLIMQFSIFIACYALIAVIRYIASLAGTATGLARSCGGILVEAFIAETRVGVKLECSVVLADSALVH